MLNLANSANTRLEETKGNAELNSDCVSFKFS